jgi:minor extracellular serine protease Vpr
MKYKLFRIILLLILTLSVSLVTFAQEGHTQPDRWQDRELPGSIAAHKLDTPLEVDSLPGNVLDSSLWDAVGANEVIIRLTAESGASAFERGANTAQARQIALAQQNAFINTVQALDPNARVIAQVQAVLNAVFVEVDSSVLPALAQDSRVVRIAPVGNYELDLLETVPYIGGSAVQSLGYDGSGIKVAVLDSGVDFTHANFDGPGTVEFYQQCYGVSPFEAGWSLAEPHNSAPVGECADYFGPEAPKVKGGYDFVGELWPFGSLFPNPNPIDFDGHGTHVADIIGGVNGVAPGVDIYAVKVCSAVSTSCSGIALIQGMEFAIDPNSDGEFDDRVDIINMSLGAPYGQPFDDDLSTAVDNATRLGVLTVASAGNSADKPYATGTPSSAASALSVAQTSVPSAVLPLMEITEPASIAGLYPAVFQPWSAPLTTVIEGPVIYGDGAGGNLLGCDPFAPGSLDGYIVLVNRGACNFTLKIKNVSEAGGLVGIIGLVDSSAPFAGGDGGDRPIDIPGYMVSLAVANTLRSGLPDTVVRFDPNVGIPLIGTVVGSSSRGPQHDATTLIKPEIGAPGASISAIAGTGAGEGPFGGTSGAAPMVSGSAALLLQAYGGTQATEGGTPPGQALGHGLKPIEVKALLMNNGETNIINDPLTGALASITRIGGGEVRVDQALAAPVAAWDNDVPSGSLSFGFVDVADDVVTLVKTVRIRNLDNKRHTYTVTPTFRFADDVANGAVTVSAPATIVVRPGLGRDTLFDVTLTIDGALLRGNFMNSGSMGANPAGLTLNEYDGYLILDDGSHPIHLAWHVLPRKAANVVPDTTDIIPGSFPQVIGLNNTGVGTAQNDAYALLAVSPNQPAGGRGEQSPTPDIRAVGINTFPVPAGFCSANPSFIWAFAVNTWERQEHLLPVSHQFWLDTNQDGIFDYIVLNRDASAAPPSFNTISDGRQLTWVLNLATGTASAFFFAEHSMNTGNTVLYICGEQIGMNAANLLNTQVNMDVIAQDFYYGGPGDMVTGLTVTPLGERFFGVANDVAGNTYNPAGLAVYDFGPFPGNTPELGLMLFTNGDRGEGNRGGATQGAEALLLFAP